MNLNTDDTKSMEHSQSVLNLFRNLALYYRRENDLSNITVCMCNSSRVFFELFVSFFFPDIDINRIASIQREATDDNEGNSRVDIKIDMIEDDMPYIIEVKIYDKHQHFGDYNRDFGVDNDHFGYIVNYNLKVCGYKVNQWVELYKCLKDMLPTVEDKFNHSLICGYLEFLRMSCGITEYIMPMKFDNLTSLNQLFETVSYILTISNETYNVKVGRLYSPVCGIRLAPFMNLSFTIEYTDQRRKSIQSGLYLYYGEDYDNPVISIAMDPESNNRLLKKFSEKKNLKKGKYYDKPYENSDYWYGNSYYWFDMKDMDKFLSSDDLKYQTDCLEKYINEVIGFCAEN